jgi:hypothetical protein
MPAPLNPKGWSMKQSYEIPFFEKEMGFLFSGRLFIYD